MIYEYAIDPDFLFEILNETQVLNNIIRATKQGMALFSNYQDPFLQVSRKLAREESQAKEIKLKASLQKKKQSLEYLSIHLSNKFIKRVHKTQTNSSLENEHSRFPFYAIMKKVNNPSNSLPYKDIEWLKTLECDFLNHEISVNSLRTKNALTKNLAPFLQNATTITFIDPYFMTDQRFTDIYSSYFRLLDKASTIRCEATPRSVIIICAATRPSKNTISYEEFKRACESTYQPILPPNIKLEIYSIEENTQEIHDRMILSNIGGVTIGHGTDENKKENKETSHTTISMLSESSLANWRKKYTPNSDDFKWSSPIIIERK